MYVAEHRSILKNYRNMYDPFLVSCPKQVKTPKHRCLVFTTKEENVTLKYEETQRK